MSGSLSFECGPMGMSHGSEAELTRFDFNLRRILVPAARLHYYLPRVSLPPSRTLSWSLPRENFQIVHG